MAVDWGQVALAAFGSGVNAINTNFKENSERQAKKQEWIDKVNYKSQLEEWQEYQTLANKLEVLPDDARTKALSAWMGFDTSKITNPDVLREYNKQGSVVGREVLDKIRGWQKPVYGEKHEGIGQGIRRHMRSKGVDPTQALSPTTPPAQKVMQMGVNPMQYNRPYTTPKGATSVEEVAAAKSYLTMASQSKNPGDFSDVEKANMSYIRGMSRFLKDTTKDVVITNQDGSTEIITQSVYTGDEIGRIVSKQSPPTRPLTQDQLTFAVSSIQSSANRLKQEQKEPLHKDFIYEVEKGKSAQDYIRTIMDLQTSIKNTVENIGNTDAWIAALKFTEKAWRANGNTLPINLSLIYHKLQPGSTQANALEVVMQNAENPTPLSNVRVMGGEGLQTPEPQPTPSLPTKIRIPMPNGKYMMATDPKIIQKVLDNLSQIGHFYDMSDGGDGIRVDALQSETK